MISKHNKNHSFQSQYTTFTWQKIIIIKKFAHLSEEIKNMLSMKDKANSMAFKSLLRKPLRESQSKSVFLSAAVTLFNLSPDAQWTPGAPTSYI